MNPLHHDNLIVNQRITWSGVKTSQDESRHLPKTTKMEREEAKCYHFLRAKMRNYVRIRESESESHNMGMIKNED